MQSIQAKMRKYKCLVLHKNPEVERGFKEILGKWEEKKKYDVSAVDVFCQHTNLEAFKGGKRYNKFDFVLINWVEEDASIESDASFILFFQWFLANKDDHIDYITYYGKVPVLCVLGGYG